MTEGLEPRRQLPIILPPVSDELLSFWITRHAAFYGVPPLIMLRHCLPEASSLRAADFRLTDVQIRHLSKMFAMEPHALRRMTFVQCRADITPADRRYAGAFLPEMHLRQQ